MDDWPVWKGKIIQLAKKESLSRPYIKKLLSGLEESKSFPYPEGMYV